MLYPEFLKENDVIGITAPSAGIGKYKDKFDKSLEKFREHNYQIIETKNVRSDKEVSSTAIERANQLDELINKEEVKAIICATGGDFLTDMLPYIKLDNIKNNPKWIMGASDPTNLLYLVTTALDIATIYGHNAASFSEDELHESQQFAINTLCGKIGSQKSYSLYEEKREERTNTSYNLDKKVIWKSNKDEVDITGRIIGGCIDCLKFLPGTKYDYTKDFIEKYKDDGIIWYFDICTMSSDDFYLTLFQMKESSWFKYVKGVIVGRVLVPSSYTSMTYQKALDEIFKDIPVIYDVDIGHVVPKMTIINGSIVNIKYKNHKGEIETYLK